MDRTKLRFILVLGLAVALAACQTSAPPKSSFGPEYDGPVGDPGFEPPTWMLQKFCASGDGIDFCQGYTIEEQRGMLLTYRYMLASMIAKECGGDTSWKGIYDSIDKWKSRWPKLGLEEIFTAWGSAKYDYSELRKSSKGALCRRAAEIEDLKGYLELKQ